MRNRWWALLAGALLLLTATTATAKVIITQDGGGIITEFQQRYATYKAAHERVVVDGSCGSACTLLLGMMPRSLVCVTPQARLGFHSAIIWSGYPGLSTPVFTREGTNMVWKAYPERVRKALRKRGWDGGEHPDVLWLGYRELVHELGMRPCAA